MDQKDPVWWQAKKVGGDGSVRLIPSTDLEERRKAYVPPEADYVHKIGICGTRVSLIWHLLEPLRNQMCCMSSKLPFFGSNDVIVPFNSITVCVVNLVKKIGDSNPSPHFSDFGNDRSTFNVQNIRTWLQWR